MFGFGKKKEKPPIQAAPETEVPKTPPYDVNNEVVFHVMPTRFKKQNVEAKQAQKTGLLIMVLAVCLIGALLLALVWYFLIYSKTPSSRNDLTSGNQAEISTTASEQNSNVSDTDNAAIPEPASLGGEETIFQPVIATATPVVSTTTEATSSETSIINQPLVIASSTDADGDGLTDPEESVLGTDKDKIDTDADGFSDLAELESGYNPVGAGRINQIKAIGNFDNPRISLDYPTAWLFTSNGDDSVIFQAGNEQLIQISLQANAKNQTIADWYKEQFGSQEIDARLFINRVDAGGNALWQGIFSPNGLTLYLMDEKRQTIASINYDLGFSGKLDYKQIFLAMIDSFVLKN